jgi:gamma-glutamyltranspeptidase/glutathione hydrolase
MKTSRAIIPAFTERGDSRMAFGIVGGSNQALAHARFVSNMVLCETRLDVHNDGVHSFPNLIVGRKSVSENALAFSIMDGCRRQ